MYFLCPVHLLSGWAVLVLTIAFPSRDRTKTLNYLPYIKLLVSAMKKVHTGYAAVLGHICIEFLLAC